MVDKYIKCKTSSVSKEDDDITVYEEVEVIEDLTDKGPSKGKKYYRVDYNGLTQTLVFRLKSGGCILIGFTLDGKPPTYIGERASGAPTF